MEHEDEPVVGFAERDEGGAEQRTGSEIERAPPLRFRPRPRLVFAAGEIDGAQREVDVVFDLLAKLVAVDHEVRAQRFVPRDHGLQRRVECAAVQRPGQRARMIGTLYDADPGSS